MRVSSATSTRIISSPEPGTCCICPPVAQVPASSKIELVTRRKERISSPPPRFPGARKWKKNFILSGEVNVNQRQDGNGATGTTRRSLSQVPRGCNGTVKVFATFARTSLTSDAPDLQCSHVVTICDLFEPMCSYGRRWCNQFN